jgi:hypothetical protein
VPIFHLPSIYTPSTDGPAKRVNGNLATPTAPALRSLPQTRLFGRVEACAEVARHGAGRFPYTLQPFP